MADFDVETGQWVRANRCRLGLTQRELASILHRDRTTLARWELGQRRLSSEDLYQLVQQFGVFPPWDESREARAGSAGHGTSLHSETAG